MQCEIINAADQVVNPLGKGTVAEFIPRNNNSNGRPDPWIKYAEGYFLCMSTVHHKGWRVRNLDTKEIIEIANLSPN